MILLTVAWPLAEPLPTPVRIIGGGLAVLGLLLSVHGARIFRRIGTNIMTFDKPDKLVTTGVFALSRNPMYLGFAICALGGAVALNGMTALVTASLFCITLYRWYVRFEERMMQETVGAQFDAYRRRVRRWV